MDFLTVFNRVIGHEGNYSKDPKDPGNWTGGDVGKGVLKGTKYGISAASYPHWDIPSLTLDQAKFIYKQDFWDKLSADTIPDGVAFQVFDFAVNSGIGTAIRKLQVAVGVADDGVWGPRSREALNKLSESDAIMRLLGIRLDYMTRLKNWDAHGKGWARRIANNLLYGALDS